MSKPAKHQTGAPTPKRPKVPIRAKLLAALFVPLVAVAGLSLVQVNQAQDRKSTVEETTLAGVALTPGGLSAALIVEQADAVVTVLDLRGTATLPTKDWSESTAQTDAALESLRKSVAEGGPVARKIYANTFADIEGNLKTQRAKVDEAAKTPGLGNWGVNESVYPAYSRTIETLLDANDQVVRAISNPPTGATAETLNDANRFNFAISVVMKLTGTSLAATDPEHAKVEVSGACATSTGPRKASEATRPAPGPSRSTCTPPTPTSTRSPTRSPNTCFLVNWSWRS